MKEESIKAIIVVSSTTLATEVSDRVKLAAREYANKDTPLPNMFVVSQWNVRIAR
jgi:hypothetical protein